MFPGGQFLQWTINGTYFNCTDIDEIHGDQFLNFQIPLISFAEISIPLAHIQLGPMSDNNNGPDWLSLDTEIRNPYFGDAMLRCGSVTDSIE